MSPPAAASRQPELEALRAAQPTAPATLAPESPGKGKPQAKAGLYIPPILLQGDEPGVPPMTGPGQKYALGPTAPTGQPEGAYAALPEAYGTGKLLLAARDPHWLYAHWDLTLQQQRHYNALSADRHLVIRVFAGAVGPRPLKEVHVHPESRHWFVHVDHAGIRYQAELGYYRPGRHWETIATSFPAATPSKSASTDRTVRYGTISVLARLTQPAATPPPTGPVVLPPLDAARERALAELIRVHLAPHDPSGSAAIPDLIRGHHEQAVSAPQALPSMPLEGAAVGVSSPIEGAEERPGGFWLSVNAELILYGATEPDASVTVAGRPIALRPDGTFSCRFALPDGDHAVTVFAQSAPGEARQATLQFSRRTQAEGEVGAAPSDPSLESPPSDDPGL